MDDSHAFHKHISFGIKPVNLILLVSGPFFFKFYFPPSRIIGTGVFFGENNLV